MKVKQILCVLFTTLLITSVGCSSNVKNDSEVNNKAEDIQAPTSKNSTKEKDSKIGYGNTNSNVVNGSSAAVYNDKIYYIEYTKSTSKNTLYKMNKDGADVTEILENAGSCVNIFDGWIYYSKRDSTGEGWSIERIKLDGTGKEILLQNPNKGSCSNLCVANGEIYYIEQLADVKGCLISRENIDDNNNATIRTGKKQTIYTEEEFSDLNVTENAIYYVKHKAEYDETNTWKNILNSYYVICKADLDGKNEKELLKAEEKLDAISELVVDGKNIYYSIKPFQKAESYIYRIEDENVETKLLVTKGDDFNIANDGYIYYKANDNTVSKINIDNYNSSEVIDTNCIGQSLNIVGDWIFYFEGKHLYNGKMKTDGTKMNS